VSHSQDCLFLAVFCSCAPFAGQKCALENTMFFGTAQSVLWEYAAVWATILQQNADKFASFPAST
jgi:hypothetical protein